MCHARSRPVDRRRRHAGVRPGRAGIGRRTRRHRTGRRDRRSARRIAPPRRAERARPRCVPRTPNGPGRSLPPGRGTTTAAASVTPTDRTTWPRPRSRAWPVRPSRSPSCPRPGRRSCRCRRAARSPRAPRRPPEPRRTRDPHAGTPHPSRTEPPRRPGGSVAGHRSRTAARLNAAGIARVHAQPAAAEAPPPLPPGDGAFVALTRRRGPRRSGRRWGAGRRPGARSAGPGPRRPPRPSSSGCGSGSRTAGRPGWARRR